jgi:aspartate aminotransferase-like enzyme
MINFTVGPVQSCEEVRAVGAQNVPYFRTPEFSAVMLENEALMQRFAKAPEGARTVFITGSGTASMEAAVMNVFTPNDKVLLINGGGFGQRFHELCEVHAVPFEEILLDTGKTLTSSHLLPYENQGFTALLINIHETSTGVHYDGQLIADFCRRNGLFLVVDAISSFLADEFRMKDWGVDVMITGSQKALACPPGVSVLVLSENAVERIQNNQVRSMYFDLKGALSNGLRGQTPFTPAVGTLLQIHARLKALDSSGGVDAETARIADLAQDFRSRIGHLPLEICSESLSNAVTPLMTKNCSAYDVFTVLKDEYGIWVCPNGGALKDKIFRVGHIGALTKDDHNVLIRALENLVRRGLLK